MSFSIDVIVPVYNGMPYVIRTLRSIANQTYKPNRVIVVNDGSKDNTLEEIQKFIQENHLNFFEIHSKLNGGHSSATNFGIKLSKSNFVALVDADDLWAPQKLEKQINVFKNSNDPKLGVVYCDFDSIDADDKPIYFPTFKLDKNATGYLFDALLKRGNLIAGSNSAVLIKKSVLEEFNIFDEKLRCGEDWEMWIAMSQKYHFDFSPEKLTFIRRHPSALSNQNMIHTHSNIYILNKWKYSVREIVGLDGMLLHLSNATVSNLKDLLFNNNYNYLIKQIEEIVFCNGKTLVFLALIFKLLRKVKRNLI